MGCSPHGEAQDIDTHLRCTGVWPKVCVWMVVVWLMVLFEGVDLPGGLRLGMQQRGSKGEKAAPGRLGPRHSLPRFVVDAAGTLLVAYSLAARVDGAA
jgi:hypothetical protein